MGSGVDSGFGAGGSGLLSGLGVGFGWSPDVRPILSTTLASGILYTDCKATNCQVGFDTWNHVKSVWTDVTATDCDTNILVQTDPPAKRTLSADPISESNPPITLTMTNRAGENAFPTL